jgi:hypothetical protein
MVEKQVPNDAEVLKIKTRHLLYRHPNNGCTLRRDTKVVTATILVLKDRTTFRSLSVPSCTECNIRYSFIKVVR